MSKMVVYSSCDETLVCLMEDEHQLLDEFFGPNNRDKNEYDRKVCENGVVEIRSTIRVDC